MKSGKPLTHFIGGDCSEGDYSHYGYINDTHDINTHHNDENPTTTTPTSTTTTPTDDITSEKIPYNAKIRVKVLPLNKQMIWSNWRSTPIDDFIFNGFDHFEPLLPSCFGNDYDSGNTPRRPSTLQSNDTNNQPNNDYKKNIFISSPHVQDGKWIQLYGGTNTIIDNNNDNGAINNNNIHLDPRVIHYYSLLNRQQLHEDKWGHTQDDAAISFRNDDNYAYNSTLSITWGLPDDIKLTCNNTDEFNQHIGDKM